MANPDAAETLRQILFAGGYRLPKSADIATQSLTKHGAVTSLGRVEIVMLGGGGNATSGAGAGTVPNVNDEGDIVEGWYLHNAFITSIELGDLDYSADELTEITVKVRYDYAQLNDTNVPIYGGTYNVTEPEGTAFTAAKVGKDPDRQD
jgi:hypothetical protein